MTALYAPADVRISEQDSYTVVKLDVDAEPPAGPDWQVQVPISSIIVDSAQPGVVRVNWRGDQP
jgi:hypothetical protein